jgi:hypothetical protein
LNEDRVIRFVTKWWLTSGILRKKGEIRDGYFYYGQPGAVATQVPPSDHFGTYREAIYRARELKKRKLASIDRQRARVEAIEFPEFRQIG